MADVVLNSAVRSNLRTLQSTTELLAQTEERLATGKKINSALDNPASFFTANALDRRASDLNSLLNSVKASVQTLEAADNGIKGITEIVEGLKATARAALQSPLAVDEKSSIESNDLGIGATPKNLLGGATTTPASAGALSFTPAGATTLADATAGAVSFTFGSATTLADAADEISFDIAIDGGAPSTITIDQAAIQAVGDNDTTIDDATELRAILTSKLGAGVTVGGTGSAISITSNTTGASSAVAISNYAVTDANANVTDGSGLGDQTDTGSAASSLSFQFAVDGGAASTITISRADVAAVGNSDGVIDDAAELSAILTSKLGSGVTVATSGGAVSITSNTTGSTSGVTISGFAAAGTTNNTGLANGTDAGTPSTMTGGLAGETLVVKDKAGQNVTVTFGTGAGQVDSLDELNKFFEDNDVLLDATFDVNTRQLKISADNSIAKSTPQAVSGTATGSGAPFATTTFSEPHLDEAAATKRANFVADYNAALKEINNIAKDSNYNGVNLLMGDDLDVVFNEDGSSKLEVKGVEFNSSGVGLPDITEDQFFDSSSINDVLGQIEAAFKTIEAQSSKFGSQLQIVQTREVFTKDMIGTLEDGAHALTAADTNEEAANLATLQTRQQLIVSSLAISTQQESAVLQLLR